MSLTRYITKRLNESMVNAREMVNFQVGNVCAAQFEDEW